MAVVNGTGPNTVSEQENGIKFFHNVANPAIAHRNVSAYPALINRSVNPATKSIQFLVDKIYKVYISTKYDI